MQASTKNKNDAELIDALFRSPSLTTGVNSIQHLSSVRVSESQLQVHIAKTVSLEGLLVELIAIEMNYASDVTLADVPALSGFLTPLAQSHVATYVSCISERFSTPIVMEAGSVRLRFLSPASFFGALLECPDALFPLWLKEAVNVSPVEFTKLYQKRSASTVFPRTHEPKRLFPDVDLELARWARSDGPEYPIFLVGDRGSGKTWQVLRFCQEQQARHLQRPWHAAPAMYVSLRRIAAEFGMSQTRPPDLYEILVHRYPSFGIRWGMPMLQAFLECRRLIVCLDGLDEFGTDGSGESIADQFGRVMELLPRGSKFIVTCRTTHFASLTEMATMPSWRGSTLSGTMRVLQLSPFGTEELKNYVRAAIQSETDSPALLRLRALIGPTRAATPMLTALERCAEEPAILARLVDELSEDSQKTDLELLRSAIEGSLISFNLDAERSSPFHATEDGTIIEFGARERVSMLGALAWYIGERGAKTVELNKLPLRIARMYGITCEALRRDLRSQTVFELDAPQRTDRDRPDLDDANGSRVRFGLRMPHAFQDESIATPEGESDGTCSVAESYFLAWHVCCRLSDHLLLPGVQFGDVLRYIGQIRLNETTSAILRQMIDAGEAPGVTVEKLTASIRKHLRELASRHDYSIYNRSIRHLIRNSVTMGLLTEADAAEIDPWTQEVVHLTRPPRALPEYEMVLIPPFGTLHSVFGAHPTDRSADEPFLLGLHEVTNLHYERFIRSVRGQDWSPERTRAASRDETSLEANKTNEYNLYFWERGNGEGRFAPPQEFTNHPVVYVSLYAAEAFCGWLRDNSEELAENAQYRLPSAAEWVWAAQGPHTGAKYPWELIPYPVAIPNEMYVATGDGIGPEMKMKTQESLTWLSSYRSAATQVLLDTGKRSNEVGLNDEFTPFAVMGLVGNVKEWVGDRPEDIVAKPRQWKGQVYGGTAYLGADSFVFGYRAELYPENTNPDVGIRAARSLSQKEVDLLKKREAHIAMVDN